MRDFLKVLNERTSAEHFDSATRISVQEIKELISEACHPGQHYFNMRIADVT